MHYAYEEGFDLRRLLPAPTNTPVDAGPYITMGMCYASHPDTGVSDVTIHRMCLQGKEELSIPITLDKPTEMSEISITSPSTDGAVQAGTAWWSMRRMARRRP